MRLLVVCDESKWSTLILNRNVFSFRTNVLPHWRTLFSWVSLPGSSMGGFQDLLRQDSWNDWVPEMGAHMSTWLSLCLWPSHELQQLRRTHQYGLQGKDIIAHSELNHFVCQSDHPQWLGCRLHFLKNQGIIILFARQMIKTDSLSRHYAASIITHRNALSIWPITFDNTQKYTHLLTVLSRVALHSMRAGLPILFKRYCAEIVWLTPVVFLILLLQRMNVQDRRPVPQ